MAIHRRHMHAPVPDAEPHFDREQYVQTVVNVVYVTASSDPSVSSLTPQQSIRRENGAPVQGQMTGSQSYTVPARQQRPSQIDSSLASSATGASSAPSFVASSSVTAFSFASSSVLAAPLASGSSAGLSTNQAIQQASTQGMSGGAKAGIAIGVLLALALVAGLGFFCWRRQKKETDEHQRLDDEKSAMHKKSQSVSSHVSVRRNHSTNAPRLSLRPVTEMFPPMSEKQDSTALAATSLAAVARARTPEPASTSPAMSTSTDSSNPFEDQSQDNAVIASPAAAATPRVASSAESSPPSQTQPFPTAVAGSRRNSPPGPGPNNVHRVQLDFKPSMEDELELRTGSLVRLLHEYDDGWALCIRLDRSQQGVVPRTCVSKLPVKPRAGPPPGAARPPPQARPRMAPNAPGPRMSPNGRPMPPQAGRARAQSNSPRQMQGPQQPRMRSNSDAMSARRITPPGVSPLSSPASSPPAPQQSVPARKPVPGQAI